MLKQTAVVAGTSLLPKFARAFNKSAFDAKSVQVAILAFGGGVLTESRDVTLTAPDIAETGAAVALGLSTTLADVKRLLLLVEKIQLLWWQCLTFQTASSQRSQRAPSRLNPQMLTRSPSWSTAERCSPKKKSGSRSVVAADSLTLHKTPFFQIQQVTHGRADAPSRPISRWQGNRSRVDGA